MKKYTLIITLLLIGYLLGYKFGIGNQKLRFGDSGLPKNCRALINDNIEGYSLGHYTAEDALNSIDRNCGRFGLIWGIR